LNFDPVPPGFIFGFQLYISVSHTIYFMKTMDKKKQRKVNNIYFVFTFLIAEVVNKLPKLGDALLIRKISFFGGFELGQKLFLLDFLASGVLYEVVSKARKI
jgi:hypothetical protein